MDPSAESKKKAKARDLLQLLQNEWPRYLIEMIVIIVSISVSFWLERMNEKRMNEEAQLNLLKNLATDISSDVNSLENLANISRKMIAKSDSLTILSKNVDDFASKKKFMALFGSILPRPNFVPKNSTFFGAESTIRIEDTELNSLLVDYYRLCDEIKARQDDESARVLNIFQPYLYNSVSATAWYSDDFESLASDGSSFKKYMNGDMNQNIIFTRKQDREGILELYNKALELATKLKSSLASKIEK